MQRLPFLWSEAVHEKGIGLMGKSYGIATKDRKLKVLPIAHIELQIAKFLIFAQTHKDLIFLVTPIGCGLAGYKVKDIAPLFSKYSIPENVKLPESFKAWIKING